MVRRLQTRLLHFYNTKKMVRLLKAVYLFLLLHLGGVGKTTLAKEVAVTVKSLFAAVEFITVSQTVDAKRIKEEVEVAAKRIKNGEKILVILLTSRSKDVCETMNATHLISVDSLPKKEAWILFKRVVGDTVETDENLKKIAEKVVEGCGGLPLIIQAVGAALKNESIESWKRALTQLQKHTTSYIDPKISLAYSHLQLSYDYLESESEILFPYCDLDSMEDARNGVQHAVKILKSTCLLLDGKDESTVKMHDVVREVALLIASKEIPQEIGNLVNLRRLEVKGCRRLSHIAPSVMSKLRWLEELHIAYYPVEDGNNEGLMEIGKLSMLTFLDLFVPHIHLIPKGWSTQAIRMKDERSYCGEINTEAMFFSKLEDLNSSDSVGDEEVIDEEETLNSSDSDEEDEEEHLNSSDSNDEDEEEHLNSSDSDDEKMLLVEKIQEQFFSKLEHLFLLDLHMLHVLWNCPDRYISLMNLVTLDICDCDKLVKLFSVNVARGLVNLQTLKIQECSSLEEVIWDRDEGDIDMVVFRCLVKIDLTYLENSKASRGKAIIKCPSLVKVDIVGCDIMDKWGDNGTYDTPNLKLVNQVETTALGMKIRAHAQVIRAAYLFQTR
ncbi:NB-ARC domains-containing protein, partial [Tanacetum coccineum]